MTNKVKGMTEPTDNYVQRQGGIEVEEKAQRQIGGILESWRTLMDDREGIMAREDGSDLRGDELRVPPLSKARRSSETQLHPLEHVTVPDQADHAIGSFHNLMRAFRHMVIDDSGEVVLIRLHLTAEFVLIRAMIESASTALWLLGPDEEETRVARALRLRYDELDHAANLAKNYAKFSGSVESSYRQAQTSFVEAQKADLQALAGDAGVEWSEVRKTLTPSSIANEGGAYLAEIGGPLTYWYWSTASSLAHGEPANLRDLSDVSLLGVDHRNRPVAHLEPSAVSIRAHLKVTVDLINKAHQLWNIRARGKQA
jgi:hypothetical protein